MATGHAVGDHRLSQNVQRECTTLATMLQYGRDSLLRGRSRYKLLGHGGAAELSRCRHEGGKGGIRAFERYCETKGLRQWGMPVLATVQIFLQMPSDGSAAAK